MLMSIVLWISLGFLFYVYLGYPLLIELLARLRPKEKYAPCSYPDVSLIIAAYNEEDILEKKLLNALQLDYPSDKLEIIVAADGSDDRTKAIVEDFASKGVILSYSPQRRGKMAAISNAVKKANAELLVFSDANNFFSTFALKLLVQPFADRRVGGTTGAKHIRKEGDSLSSSEGLYWRYESWIKKNESRLNTCTAAAGEILALCKDLFPEKLPAVVNDDFYLILTIIKNGCRIAYVPGAESWERVSGSPQEETKRRARITAGRFQALVNSWQWLPWNNPGAVWQIISHKYFRLFIPFAMLLALLSNLYLVVHGFMLPGQVHAWIMWIMAAQTAFYLLAGLGRNIEFEGIWKVLYLPAFLLNSNLATLRGFYRHLNRKQDVLWDKVQRR